MSKAIYGVTDGGVTLKCNKMYRVVDGNITQKIDKAYVVAQNSLTRLVFASDPVNYTGDYEISEVTVDGVACTLYTLKSSGTLTLEKSAEYWMCGGGSGNGIRSGNRAGYGGGGGYIADGDLDAGEWVITIGAGGRVNSSTTNGGGQSKIVGATTITANGGSSKNGNGGCGGGAPGLFEDDGTDPQPGTGSGKSCYPFGITSLKAHCPGGGGGVAAKRRTTVNGAQSTGGKGGTQGGKGGARGTITTNVESASAASGGSYGGGKGGGRSNNTTLTAPTAGSFYGAGAGGMAILYNPDTSKYVVTEGAAGYQGVMYLLIPA